MTELADMNEITFLSLSLSMKPWPFTFMVFLSSSVLQTRRSWYCSSSVSNPADRSPGILPLFLQSWQHLQPIMSKPAKGHPNTEAPTLPPLSVGTNNRPVSSTGSHAHGDVPKVTAPAPNGPPKDSSPPKPHRSPGDEHHHHTPRHRFLSPTEWGIVAHGIGGIRDREQHTPIHPTSWVWPPRGMPRGLYKDTVTQRTKFFYLHHVSSGVRWILMLLQLFIGATLTALGSMSFSQGTPITVLGAANTVIAGLLAFLQNSGLPDRYRYDKSEFEALEDHIKEILDSGIAPADQTADQILAECFDLYQDAKATVSANLPANYMQPRNAQQAVQRAGGLIQTSPLPSVAKQLADSDTSPGGK